MSDTENVVSDRYGISPSQAVENERARQMAQAARSRQANIDAAKQLDDMTIFRMFVERVTAGRPGDDMSEATRAKIDGIANLLSVLGRNIETVRERCEDIAKVMPDHRDTMNVILEQFRVTNERVTSIEAMMGAITRSAFRPMRRPKSTKKAKRRR